MSKVAEYKMVDGEMKVVARDMTEEEMAEMPIPNGVEMPTQLDRIEAQVLFTALMTDTLIEEE